MGLLKSFKNGTQTDLRQKKFGKDRPGAGSSNQPYVQQSIDDTMIPGSSTDGLIRGGLNAATTALEDANRLADLLFDDKNPAGFLFVNKQRLLSKISPKTPASFGSGYTGGTINQGVYSPISTVQQAEKGFSGLHIERFGLLLGSGLNRYDAVVQGKSNNGVPSDSRVFGLQQALFTDNGAPQGTLDVFKVSDNNDTPVVLEYSGGPGSNTGEGNTLLKYSTTPLGGKSTININTEGTFFKTSFDLEQPNFTTAIDLTDKKSGLGLQLINENRYLTEDNFNIQDTFDLIGNGTNKWGLGINVNPKAATTVVGGLLTTNIKIENTLFTPIPDPTEDVQFNRPRDISNKRSTISSIDNLYTQFFVDRDLTPAIKQFSGPEGDKFGISNVLINKATDQFAAPINSNINLTGTYFQPSTQILDRNFTTPIDLSNKSSFLSLKDLYDNKIKPGVGYTNLYQLEGNSSDNWGLGNGLIFNLATDPEGAPQSVSLLKPDAGTYFINPISVTNLNLSNNITSTGTNTDNNGIRLKRLYEDKKIVDGIIRDYDIKKNISDRLGFQKSNNIRVATDNNNAPIILQGPEFNTSFPPATQNTNNNITVEKKIQSAYDSIQSDSGENINRLNGSNLATDNNNSPVGSRTINKKYDQQLTFNEIKAKPRQGVTDGNYPTSIPEIGPDFRKSVKKFNTYASSYNTTNGRKDTRVKYGNPGGTDSKVVGSNKQSPFKSFTSLNSSDVLDKINASKVYKAEQANTSLKDLVNFRIGIIDNDNPKQKDYIHFRAFLKDIDDKYVSSWDALDYVGRSEKFYNYKGGFERTISTSWVMAAQSKGELLPMYQKLNFLASTLAGDYSSAGYNRGNLSTLTIGDYVVEQPGFFKNISFKMKEGNSWELGINQSGTQVGPQLCHIIEVSGFDFTCIHDFRPQKLADQFDSGRAFILNSPSTNYINSSYSPV